MSTTPGLACDAYSTTCLIPPALYDAPQVATSTPTGPATLPVTGGGLTLLVFALVVILIGVSVTYLSRKRGS